jgi:hypothetical protein
MRQLALSQILEYYDVPQIFVATDATGVRYLCTLYGQSETDGYKYLGVQISEPRLLAFVGGQLDLREAYLHPEVENAVYNVIVQHEAINATMSIAQQDITEDMLPEAGYFFDTSDLSDDTESASDTYQLEVPVHDRMTFSTLVSRMGWRALSLHKNIGKVAVL